MSAAHEKRDPATWLRIFSHARGLEIRRDLNPYDPKVPGFPDRCVCLSATDRFQSVCGIVAEGVKKSTQNNNEIHYCKIKIDFMASLDRFYGSGAPTVL